MIQWFHLCRTQIVEPQRARFLCSFPGHPASVQAEAGGSDQTAEQLRFCNNASEEEAERARRLPQRVRTCDFRLLAAAIPSTLIPLWEETCSPRMRKSMSEKQLIGWEPQVVYYLWKVIFMFPSPDVKKSIQILNWVLRSWRPLLRSRSPRKTGQTPSWTWNLSCRRKTGWVQNLACFYGCVFEI